MTANNVIEFPASRLKVIDGGKEELSEELETARIEYLDKVVETIGDDIVKKIGKHGFQVTNEMFIKDLSYTIESLRCAIYRQVGLHHPFTEHISDITADMIFDGDFDDIS